MSWGQNPHSPSHFLLRKMKIRPQEKGFLRQEEVLDFLSDLFRIFELTMVVVRGRGEGCNVFNIHIGSLRDT